MHRLIKAACAIAAEDAIRCLDVTEAVSLM